MFEAINSIDIWINNNIALFHSDGLNQLMIVITNLASPAILGSLTLILVFLLILDKEYKNSVLVVVSMVLTFLIEYFAKIYFHRARPTNALIEMHDYSFPSGHASMSLVFFTLLIIIFRDEIKNMFLKRSFNMICILLFLSIGFSRIYLNTHWLTDVLAGFSLGALTLGFSYWAVNKFYRS